MRLEHLLAWIAHEPWAIEYGKAREILAVLALRAGNSEPDVAQRIHPSRERSVRNRDGSVAVVALHGVMAQRRLPGQSTGGGASTEAVGQEIDKATADSTIKAIVLHVDSPGGSVSGTRELAAKVRAARDVKTVIAQIDSVGASAAYWVASQATEVVSTPGGLIGSIGVLAVHENISALLEQQGIQNTIISAGKYKAEANPFGPLSDEARDHLQQRVNESYRDFVSGVAAGRGVDLQLVENKYGEGRVLSAPRAQRAGMIDRIATFDETMARFTRGQTKQRRAVVRQAQARI